MIPPGDAEPLNELLQLLLVLALHRAPQVPTPNQPPDVASEQAADEYCLRLAASQKPEIPSPSAAVALIPRLRAALLFAPAALRAFGQQAALGDSAINESAILEWLLVRQWSDSWKAAWLSGKFQ